ncbi:MAG: hypothetical protein IJF04_04290 [Oscillospiraceae bacterium]|nr:hypothetical protein [Oscillospiraceae bacterium]
MKEENKKTIKAYILWILLGVVLAFLLIPFGHKVDINVPAVMIDTDTGEITQTKVIFEGEWVYRYIWPFSKEYEGDIIIDALDYTKNEERFLSSIELIKFDATTDGREIRLASYFYLVPGASSKDFTGGHATLFTDKDFEKFMFRTGPSTWDEENEEYYVFAPAETEDEAKAICDEIGMVYPVK